MIETDFYKIPLPLYQKVQWYAEQMGVTVDYLLDEFYIQGGLHVPSSCTPYDYECAS